MGKTWTKKAFWISCWQLERGWRWCFVIILLLINKILKPLKYSEPWCADSLGWNHPLKLLTGSRSIFCCATFCDQMMPKVPLGLEVLWGCVFLCVCLSFLFWIWLLLRLWELTFLQVNYCSVWEDVRRKSSTINIDSLWEKCECSSGRAICSEQLWPEIQ